jgi:HSP20 family molecular chaperone IbpA
MESDRDVRRAISREHVGRSHNYPGYDIYYTGRSGRIIGEMHGFTKTDVDVLKSSWKRRGIVYKDYSEK